MGYVYVNPAVILVVHIRKVLNAFKLCHAGSYVQAPATVTICDDGTIGGLLLPRVAS